MTEKIISQKKKFICDKCGKETEVVEHMPEDWELVMSGGGTVVQVKHYCPDCKGDVEEERGWVRSDEG